MAMPLASSVIVSGPETPRRWTISSWEIRESSVLEPHCWANCLSVPACPLGRDQRAPFLTRASVSNVAKTRPTMDRLWVNRSRALVRPTPVAVSAARTCSISGNCRWNWLRAASA